MGGSGIEVASQVGKGSKFSFSLDFSCSAKELEGNCNLVAEMPTPHEFSGKRLLLAEDIDINQEIILSLFEGSDFAIDVAQNGVEAIEKVQNAKQPYDLVLMDVKMPEMDGLEATRLIRRWPGAAQKTPIIAMTANVFTDDVLACLEAGMDEHIGSPSTLGKCWEKSGN
ncbi:MAG: response regulator [Turicibacter sp.]|nr:response regulator [Turicibacter sp.]